MSQCSDSCSAELLGKSGSRAPRQWKEAEPGGFLDWSTAPTCKAHGLVGKIPSSHGRMVGPIGLLSNLKA